MINENHIKSCRDSSERRTFMGVTGIDWQQND